MVTLYGIPNCDTVKKARRWLGERGVVYCFHDFRKDGLGAALLGQWVAELGWEVLLNRRGLVWRRLPEALKAGIGIDETRAIQLMIDNPALIKRPVLDAGDLREVGFSEDRYREIFG